MSDVSLEDLTKYIDADVVITSNWIASTFEVGISDAVDLLQRYHIDHSGSTTAHYCVSGRYKSGFGSQSQNHSHSRGGGVGGGASCGVPGENRA